ncbi:MAG: hypothetical protein IT427_01480 [Pirellulales bacterium]|nr:hypothetical protein [Pirellulales bacterium]
MIFQGRNAGGRVRRSIAGLRGPLAYATPTPLPPLSEIPGLSQGGWANYLRLGPVSNAYRAVDRHAADRLRRWLCRKHKVRGLGFSRFPNEQLDQLGLQRLWSRTRNLPWAKA